ncbi:carbohydrate ABC transporter permease [Paenibacillus koleovorans]|uniref:carbohydrate ABC transporter permease n=1 Tax=Paenibacillus koleovorans TaxID=121608 RepID=UPI001C3F96BE|nr:carbohydrate ABC transporter permease [Paenibacillus koleovorans]
MIYQKSLGRKVFEACNYTFLAILTFLCFMPMLQVLAVSLSSSTAAQAGKVVLWPVEFTFKAYSFVAAKPEFLLSLLMTGYRELLAVPISMLLTVLLAYPLSKESSEFRFRTLYVWIFVFTMLFQGGLIPTYILIQKLGLLNSVWSLVLPHAVPIFNVILLLNFFRGIPKELLEAAYIDGASHMQTMWRIVLPVSVPAIATVGLFTAVSHWNAWFDGIIYMNDTNRYPLSSYLQTVIVQRDLSTISASELAELDNISDRTVRAAQVFLGALPILLVYPFLQRYFMKGIVMGSVKE